MSLSWVDSFVPPESCLMASRYEKLTLTTVVGSNINYVPIIEHVYHPSICSDGSTSQQLMLLLHFQNCQTHGVGKQNRILSSEDQKN
jgi:hypothetical protein